MRRTKIVATIGPASRDVGRARADDRAGHGRRPAELLPRHAARSTRRPPSGSGPPPSAPGARWRSSRTCPARSCGSASCAEGVIELKPGEHLDARVRPSEIGNHDRVTLAGRDCPRRSRPGRCPLPDRRHRCACASTRCATARSTPVVELGGTVASHQGLNVPGELAVAAVGGRGGPRPPRASASRSASTWSRCRSCAGPRTWPTCASTRACR